MAAELPLAHEPVESLPPGAEAVARGNPLGGHEAHVVPVASVRAARVAEADKGKK